MRRREFLKYAGASCIVWHSPLAFSETTKDGLPPKIIWVLLRGAMDSLHTVIPAFESELIKVRPTLAADIGKEAYLLDRGFSLHPALPNIYQMFRDNQLAPIVAVSSGYQERSHFDGQDFLECGLPRVDHESGWLARAIEQKHLQALAVQNSTSLSLRGSSNVSTWFPSNFKEAPTEIFEQLMKLYQNDELLKSRLIDGIRVHSMTGIEDSKSNRENFVALASSCADLLTKSSGVDCAMLELGGWDTHNNEKKRLAKKLAELDNGLLALKQGLGRNWQNAVVIVASEFGRTVRENGTGGTDHGTGGAMLIAGGAISGGQVLGTWPGLALKNLYQERDLMPTSNIFSWIATLLKQHWKMDKQQLESVFPGIQPYEISLVNIPREGIAKS